MEKKIVEHNELIATRVPPGDRWSLVGDPKKEVFKTLTDTLEAYMMATGFKGEYRLAPLKSELYAVSTTEEVIEPEPEKRYSIYGEY